MEHDEFDAQKTLNNQNVQHGRWTLGKLIFGFICKLIPIILTVGVFSLFAATMADEYFNPLNLIDNSQRMSPGVPLSSSTVQPSPDELSTCSRRENAGMKTEQPSLLDSSGSFIDRTYDITVYYRDQSLPNDIYSRAIEEKRKFIRESGSVGKFYNYFAPARIKVDPPHSDAAAPWGTKSYILFSKEISSGPLLPPSVASDYILRPIFAFRDLRQIDMHDAWYLTSLTKVLFTEHNYTSENIRVILRDIILGIDLAQKEGYFVKNFEKLEVFAKTSVPAGGSGEYEEITGGQILDDGNFVKSESLSYNAKRNYLQDSKHFLKNIVKKFFSGKNANLIGEAQNDEVGPEIPDFYSIVNDFIASNVSTISELLDHPFMTDGPITNPDLYNGKPEGSDHTISTVN